jgi:hypothetical protein
LNLRGRRHFTRRGLRFIFSGSDWKDYSFSAIAEGTADVFGHFDVLLVLASYEKGGIDAGEDFIERQ